jgi:hypothetical protein
MAQGTLGHRVSGLAQRTSAFVHSGDRAGWARGPALAVAAPSDCVELTPPGEGQTAHEQGTFEDGGASYAWFLSIPAGQPRARVFSVHPVAGCSVGAALHERPIAHRAAAVHVFNSDARGGHVLVAVLDRQWPSLESTLVVYEARRPIPVLELRGRVLGLEVGATVGPDLADGYFPLKVLSGAEQTWFTWVDGGLAPVPPPPAVLPAASAR